jgi:type IV secretion system protein VirB4
LQNQLGEWLEGRPYGMFDGEADDFSLSRWTTVEMIDIMSVDRLAMAFMDYVFRKIFVSLDGTPTMIYLEEATFLLEDERFRDVIDDWLKTFRKKGAFLWLTIQSPTAITHKSIGAAMLDNIFTFLLLPNDRVEAHRDGYIKNFGLQDYQVDTIKSLQPRRDYLLVQGTSSRILHASFTPEVLAFVRSEAAVLNLYHRVRQEYKQMHGDDDGWKDKYLEAVLGR